MGLQHKSVLVRVLGHHQLTKRPSFHKFMKAKEKKEALNAFKQVELVFCVQLYSIICYRLYFILSI